MQLSPGLAVWPALRCPSYSPSPHGRVQLRELGASVYGARRAAGSLRRTTRLLASADRRCTNARLLIWPPGATPCSLSATASRSFTGVRVDRAKSARQEATETLSGCPPSFREHSACLRRSLLTGSAGPQPSWKRYSQHKTHAPLVLHTVYCDTTTARQSQPTATLACPPRRQGPSVRYYGRNPLDLRRPSPHPLYQSAQACNPPGYTACTSLPAASFPPR